MSLGFDYDELKRQWDGARAALQGQAIWDPFTRTYVPVPPAAIPSGPPSGLTTPGPNSTDARLQHVAILRAQGIITDQEAAELSRRITSGM
jgi:hypothetical protein